MDIEACRKAHDDRLSEGRHQNHGCMGGNRDNNKWGNNDPYCKTKFKILFFVASANPEAYLD